MAKVRGYADIPQLLLAHHRISRLPSRIASKQAPAMSDQLTFDLDADRDNDSPLIGTCKNERTLMAYSFFSLTREHQIELPRYDDGRFSIEVKGTSDGVASIWDKEVLRACLTISRPSVFKIPCAHCQLLLIDQEGSSMPSAPCS
jgi:hypothetical protein